MATWQEDKRAQETMEAEDAEKFAKKMSSACTAIADLPIQYHGGLKGTKHSRKHSAWSTAETITAGMNNCTRAQEILQMAGFSYKDKSRLQMAAAMLKNRAESLSAESDGLPSLATFYSAWIATIVSMLTILLKSGSSPPAVIVTLLSLMTSAFFLAKQLSTRRNVSTTKELANHVEIFAKSLKPPVELDPPFRLQPTDRKRSNA